MGTSAVFRRSSVSGSGHFQFFPTFPVAKERPYRRDPGVEGSLDYPGSSAPGRFTGLLEPVIS